MYYLMLVLTLITPLTMLLVGLLWKAKPPKFGGSGLAYRTQLSARSQEAWDFAHKHISKLWVRIGLMLTVLTAVLMVMFRDSASRFFLWLIAGQMAFLCISAFLVDGTLKASFDQEGKPL